MPAASWKPWLPALAGLVAGATAIAALPAPVLFIDHQAQHAGVATGERWACPMMDFIGDHPGNCPVCGMQLQKVTAGEISRAQAKRMGVEVVAVAAAPAAVTVHAYGAVRYDDRQQEVVIPRVSGRVVKRHHAALHPGIDVHVGDPLLDLYSPEVFVAESELAAAVKLGNQDIINAGMERFRRWNLAAVAEAIRGGAAPSDTVTIASPFSGRVIMSEEDEKAGLIKVGSAVTPDMPILRLTEAHSYMVVVHVPEPRARLIRAGQRVAISSDDAGPLPDIDASVTWVAPELNPEIRAREVHLHLADPRDRLLPGSLVNARFRAVLGPDLQAADPDDRATWGSFVLVPKDAVLSTGVRDVAWKLTGTGEDGSQRFAIAPLDLGPRLEGDDGRDYYPVKAGLAAGDRVAARGLFLIDAQAQLAGTPSLLYPTGAGAPAAGHQH